MRLSEELGEVLEEHSSDRHTAGAQCMSTYCFYQLGPEKSPAYTCKCQWRLGKLRPKRVKQFLLALLNTEQGRE